MSSDVGMTIRVYGPNCNGCRREGTHAMLQIDGAQHFISKAQLSSVQRSLERGMGAFGVQIEFRALGQPISIPRTEATRLQEQIDAVLKERRILTFAEKHGSA